MTNQDVFDINIPILVIGFKINALIKTLDPEKQEIFKNCMEEAKITVRKEIGKHLTEEKLDEICKILDGH
ncbi:hypothetical protein ACHRV5_00355 [Flavobacterium sp. FlaQc-52]|jgi:benzoyl-CoA reductase/2-hydroxyglutaryl-CoA dehydratase subunit BcrC/BadD/HgdB|uniref:hypothetical protein n=1 Tax=Flavobacterium sp. FlaQc-52 TaxID=3374185 RepID=UPI0037566FA2